LNRIHGAIPLCTGSQRPEIIRCIGAEAIQIIEMKNKLLNRLSTATAKEAEAGPIQNHRLTTPDAV
jgi:hypothetical protein